MLIRAGAPVASRGVYTHPTTVRYFEVDQQGVVFNGWYLHYFDEAMSGFLADRGLPYAAMLEAGFDVQLVRSEIDWKAGLRWQDAVRIGVSTARTGRTSFALDFEVRRGGAEDYEVTCTGRTVYVVTGTDGTGKREIPPQLRRALDAS